LQIPPVVTSFLIQGYDNRGLVLHYVFSILWICIDFLKMGYIRNDVITRCLAAIILTNFKCLEARNSNSC
jgi:hypothetical protein